MVFFYFYRGRGVYKIVVLQEKELSIFECFSFLAPGEMGMMAREIASLPQRSWLASGFHGSEAERKNCHIKAVGLWVIAPSSKQSFAPSPFCYNGSARG